MSEAAAVTAAAGLAQRAKIRIGIAWWVVGLAALVLVVHAGSLVHETVDWDEATFMLMAHDVRLGHLPYVYLFDLKPPGLFVLMAGVFSLLGESLWIARLVGVLAVIFTTIFTALIARRVAGPRFAGLAAA